MIRGGRTAYERATTAGELLDRATRDLQVLANTTDTALGHSGSMAERLGDAGAAIHHLASAPDTLARAREAAALLQSIDDPAFQAVGTRVTSSLVDIDPGGFARQTPDVPGSSVLTPFHDARTAWDLVVDEDAIRSSAAGMTQLRRQAVALLDSQGPAIETDLSALRAARAAFEELNVAALRTTSERVIESPLRRTP